MLDALAETPPSGTCPATGTVRFSVPTTVFALTAATVAVTGEVTAVVSIANVAVPAPEGTVTVNGTDTAGLLVTRATVTPLGPAAEFSVTVPVPVWPPVR